ncbi:MAG: CoA pyrophosphatase [Alphaproteobacteria bacterium]
MSAPASAGDLRRRLVARLDFASLDAPRDVTPQEREFVPPGTPIREAAVLVPIIARAEPQVLPSLRPDTLPRHAGQVAFRAAACFPAMAASARAGSGKVQEEVGLVAAAVDPVGSLPRFVSPSGFRVAPVVALVDPNASLHINREEVVEAFEVPFARLMDASLVYPAHSRLGRAGAHLFRDRVWRAPDLGYDGGDPPRAVARASRAEEIDRRGGCCRPRPCA